MNGLAIVTAILFAELLVNIRQAMATALGDKVGRLRCVVITGNLFMQRDGLTLDFVRQAELVQDGNYLYTLLESCNLTRDGSPHLIDVLESSVDVLTDGTVRRAGPRLPALLN
jgi:hypothetical protein